MEIGSRDLGRPSRNTDMSEETKYVCMHQTPSDRHSPVRGAQFIIILKLFSLY